MEAAVVAGFELNLKASKFVNIGADDFHGQCRSKLGSQHGFSISDNQQKARHFGFTIDLAMTSIGILIGAVTLLIHPVKSAAESLVRRGNGFAAFRKRINNHAPC